MIGFFGTTCVGGVVVGGTGGGLLVKRRWMFSAENTMRGEHIGYRTMIAIGFVCFASMTVSFAYGLTDSRCVVSCDNKHDQDMTECSAEYLKALLKCHSDDEKCFDEATDEYIECINTADVTWIACMSDCSDMVVPPPPDTFERCVSDCEIKDRQNRDKCFSDWYSGYNECQTLPTQEEIDECVYGVQKDYGECRKSANEANEACLRGCEGSPSS